MTTKTTRTEVYCSLQVEGTHNWPECPFDEVAYLRAPHRHVFFIKAYKEVFHSNRDVEFIMLKHQILQYLSELYYDGRQGKLHVFGAKSCEMLAHELIKVFGLTKCDVSEDGENGSVVTVEDHD
jgi:hypothetical protein